MRTKDEVDEALLKDCRIFHYGTLSMTHESCREATRYAIALAEQANAILSFDPNLREPLWESLDIAREQVDYGLRHCHILKISDNEIQWFTGEEDYDKGIRLLQEQYQIPFGQYSVELQSDIPVCACYGRLDRRYDLGYYSTGYCCV